jgi:hypothetical protein
MWLDGELGTPTNQPEMVDEMARFRFVRSVLQQSSTAVARPQRPTAFSRLFAKYYYFPVVLVFELVFELV